MKCQLTYLPFATSNVKEEVEQVIDFIDTYDVEYTIGELSTLIEGDRKEFLALGTELYSQMDDAGKHFRLHIELLSSND